MQVKEQDVAKRGKDVLKLGHSPRHPVRHTLLGKVVYKRARHFFNYKDVLRIIKHLTTFEGSRPATPEEFFKDVSRIELGILSILNRYYGNRLGADFIDFLSRLFEAMSAPGFNWVDFITQELLNGQSPRGLRDEGTISTD